MDAFSAWCDAHLARANQSADDEDATRSECCFADCVPLRFAEFTETGRGLAASRDLAVGERLMRVPERCLLTSSSIMQDAEFAGVLRLASQVAATKKEWVGVAAESEDVLNLCSGSSGRVGKNVTGETISGEWPLRVNDGQLNRAQYLQNVLLHPVAVNALFMLRALRTPSSFWHLFMLSLPASYDSALHFDEQTLAALLDPVLAAKARRRQDKVRCLYARLVAPMVYAFPEVFGGPNAELGCGGANATADRYSISERLLESDYSLDKFFWAYSGVMSRCFHMDREDVSAEFRKLSQATGCCAKDGYAMAPFLDGLNHSLSGSSAAWFNKETRCFEVFTECAWEAGSQVFIQYGQHDNFTLLDHYGFVLAENPNDSIALHAALITAPAFQEKYRKFCGIPSCADLLSRVGLGAAFHELSLAELPVEKLRSETAPPVWCVTCSRSEPFAWPVVCVLRLMFGCSTVAELGAGIDAVLTDEPVSLGSEREVWGLLRECCTRMLLHTTGIDQLVDRQLKQLGDVQNAVAPPDIIDAPARHVELCNQYRRERQLLLFRARSYCQARIRELA